MEKAEVLNRYFSTVFTKEASAQQPIFSDRPFIEQLTDISFDGNSIEKRLNNLKVNKSPGPDQLHPRFLKETSGVLKYPLQKLLSRCMERGKVPETWKTGHVTPIFIYSLPSDVVNASSVNSFKGRLDKHWKDFMFTLELPPRTVTHCH